MERFTPYIIIGLLCATPGAAQQFYTPVARGIIYEPTQGEDLHLFNLNAASNSTVGFKGGAYGIRHFRESKFTANDDAKTLTHSRAHENIYGLSLLTDLGAGMSAGVDAERNYTESVTSRSSVTNEARDLMLQQSINGRISIDLATGLRVAFILRYISVEGDFAGTFFGSGETYRVRYHGNLIGNGAGAQYINGNFSVSAAYMPATRGKSEIMFEERIITDPGMALAGGAFKFGPHTVGLGIQRWIHRRDERTISVPSTDGQRTLVLNGLDTEKNIFPIAAYHLGFEFTVTSGNILRISASRKDSNYISDQTTAPTTTTGYESMSELDYNLSLRLIRGNHDVLGGVIKYSRGKTLTSKSGNPGAIYNSNGSAMFVSWGAKI